MLRCFTALICGLLLFFEAPALAIASCQPPVALEEALRAANNEIFNLFGLEKYFRLSNCNSKPITLERWKEKERNLFVYGNPYGETKDVYDFVRHRYIGETNTGEDFTNPFFPHDTWTGGVLEDRKWVYDPLKNKTLKEMYDVKDNRFDNQEIFLPSIQSGLKKYYGDVILGDQSPMWNRWHEYVHILQPPTKWAWGLGRMWHRDSSGKLWYISVPMVPMVDASPPDLSTTLHASSFSNVEPGQVITSSVTYSLNDSHNRPEIASVQLCHAVNGSEYPVKLLPVNPADVPDGGGHVMFNPGDVKMYNYIFTVQDRQTRILSSVDPVYTDQDSDWINNRDEATVIPNLFDVAVKIHPAQNPWLAYANPEKIFFSVIIERNDRLGGILPAKLTITGAGETVIKIINLDGNGCCLQQYFMAAPGSYNIRAEAWPAEGSWTDMLPQNNVDTELIRVQLQKIPDPLDSKLWVEGLH